MLKIIKSKYRETTKNIKQKWDNQTVTGTGEVNWKKYAKYTAIFASTVCLLSIASLTLPPLAGVIAASKLGVFVGVHLPFLATAASWTLAKLTGFGAVLKVMGLIITGLSPLTVTMGSIASTTTAFILVSMTSFVATFVPSLLIDNLCNKLFEVTPVATTARAASFVAGIALSTVSDITSSILGFGRDLLDKSIDGLKTVSHKVRGKKSSLKKADFDSATPAAFTPFDCCSGSTGPQLGGGTPEIDPTVIQSNDKVYSPCSITPSVSNSLTR